MEFLKKSTKKISCKKKEELPTRLKKYNYVFKDNVSNQLCEQDLIQDRVQYIDATLKEINKDLNNSFNTLERKKFKKVNLSQYNYRFKSDKNYYGERKDASTYESKSIAHNISLKNSIEDSLKKREIVLKERIEAQKSKTIITSTDVLKEKIDKLSNVISIDHKLFLFIGSFIISVFDKLFKNISELLTEDEIDDAYEYKYIIEEYEEIKKARRLIRSLSRQISFHLNLTKKLLRNLRHIFTKLHSFHFKNLDDYDSTALTSVLVG